MDDKKASDDVDETEVWSAFSATHHYKRSSTGVMEHVSSDYFQADPFRIERPEKISKEDLIGLLEPAKQIDDE